MYPHLNDRDTLFLVLSMAILTGILSTWLLTGPAHRNSLGGQVQGLKFMLSSQGRQPSNPID